MLNANIKKGISILTAIALTLIAGCSSPEEKRARSLAEIANLKAAGDDATALKRLETLSQSFPDDGEILRQIGLLHQKMGNDSEAAFYLGAAQNLSPDNLKLLHLTYLAYEKAGQTDSAQALLEAFAKANPTAMTNTQWFRLGELRAQKQETETALEAYLEGIKLTEDKPSAEIALAIGTLFKQLNNTPMARRWLAIAAKGDDSSALQALFSILEMNLRSKNWEDSEKTIALLDKKFPGAVDASEWANVRSQLKKWRTAQAEMKAKLEQLTKAKQAEQAEQAKRAEQAKQAEQARQAEQAEQAEPAEPSNETAISSDPPPETSGKAQVVTDIANAKALADTPASEAEPQKPAPEPSATQTESSEPTIVFNPSIAIQPADPNLDFESNTADEQDEGNLVDYSAESSPSSEAQPKPQKTQPEIIKAQPEITKAQPEITKAQPEIIKSQPKITKTQPEITQSQPEPAPELNVSLPDTTLLSLDELINNAKEAASRRNYEKAIQMYWYALGRANKRADIWNNLSKVYLSDGQAKNAATTALKATRLDPENVQYVLDYLRVAQRVKRPANFIKELEIAYDRFPRSPEITLSLARGYEQIGSNNQAADILYRRFIKMAPAHPLRPEAEAALKRMR